MASSSPARALPATLEELAALHATDDRFLKAKISQLSKPKLGQKPLSKEQIEAQSEKLTTETRERQAAERLEVATRVAAAVAAGGDAHYTDAPVTLAKPASPEAAPQQSPHAAAPTTPAPALEVLSPMSSPGSAGTRAERRRQKKAGARADAEHEAAAAAAASPAAGPSAKDAELAQLRAQLSPLGLGLRQVAADGNCLFRAVADQLSLLRAPGGSAAASAPSTAPPTAAFEHAELRRRAAEHIRLHPSEFGPFLPYEPGDGYPEGVEPPPAAVRAAVDRYCARMAQPGVWGGAPELRALATHLLTPIVVHEAGAPPQTLRPLTDAALRSGEADAGGDGQPLQLSYHRHYYALGEHYNSVVPAAAAPRPAYQ